MLCRIKLYWNNKFLERLFRFLATFEQLHFWRNFDSIYWHNLYRPRTFLQHCYAFQSSPNFWACCWNPKMWAFKWKALRAVLSRGSVSYAVPGGAEHAVLFVFATMLSSLTRESPVRALWEQTFKSNWNFNSCGLFSFYKNGHQAC